MAKVVVEIGGKQVVYDECTKSWSYDSVAKDLVEKVNPQLAEEVTQFVEKDLVAYKERIAKEEADKRAQAVAVRVAELGKFKSEVLPLVQGYEVSFPSVDILYNTVKSITIKKCGIHSEVTYDSMVYDSKGWRSHKTDKVWVRLFEYKRIKFATLEGAIENAIKCIDEKSKQADKDAQIAKTSEEKRQNMQEVLKENGIDFKVDSRWVNDSCRRGHGYESKTNMAEVVVKSGIVVNAPVFDTEGKIMMGRITITGQYTTEQFNQIVTLVKEIGG